MNSIYKFSLYFPLLCQLLKYRIHMLIDFLLYEILILFEMCVMAFLKKRWLKNATEENTRNLPKGTVGGGE